MKPIVLDTDVVSFLFKSASRAQAYLPQLQDRQWFITFMTEAELALVSTILLVEIDFFRRSRAVAKDGRRSEDQPRQIEQ